MARVTGMKNTKTFLTQRFSMKELTVGRCMSNFTSSNQIKNPNKGSTAEADQQTAAPARCWVPHPRSGIYFPVGGEWVMDGIPNDAASFDRTFWLRDIDGVEEPHHDDCNYHN
ncbi:hypothetical protein CDL12_12082 [Handroanthus impetiginosus]|uniref:Uncharacterized protein n=1 Tax=Handroanthus impetiginosus TaxID=429701 RepID=A0A2G9HCP0_9LAMI|nr:hypothetical protein CDL12_12082 [Handroanthus impetiginosus]